MNHNPFKYFATAGRWVNVILITSILAVILITFVFSDVPQIFRFGHESGVIISQLGLAYIASYIFYLLVVHVPRERDLEHIQDFVALKSRQIVTGVLCTTGEILRAAEIEGTRFPTKEQLEKALDKVRPAKPGPKNYRHPVIGAATWWDYFKYWKNHIDNAIPYLLANSQYIGAEHMRLILTIQDSAWFGTLIRPISRNQNCAVFATTLYDFSQLGMQLEEYCNEHFPKPE